MRKSLIVTLALSLTLALAGCGKAANDGADVKGEGVMTYADYVAADVDSEVVVETYGQAKQGWWENEGVGVATFYTQDKDGAYFLYNMPCSKEDYDKLTEGTKIKVTGYKSEWAGEVEIIDATYDNWDGSGSEGDDLYFNVSYNGETYTFTVESYLCGPDTDVYQAVKALEVGQTVDMEGFLYWYEGVNPHITSVTVK